MVVLPGSHADDVAGSLFSLERDIGGSERTFCHAEKEACFEQLPVYWRKMAAASGLLLNAARKKLHDAIGDDFKMYLRSMKLWFRQKITKEEFDTDARKFLNEDTVHLHNDFLLAILNKCQSLCSSSSAKDASHNNHPSSKDKVKKGKLAKKRRPTRATFEYRFQMSSPLLYAPTAVSKEPSEENKVSFCVREWTLPDIGMIHGRMFITAWDSGLDSVDDEAVQAVMSAVRLCLKSLVTALAVTRNAFKLREGKFKYAVGSPALNPYLKSTCKVITEDSVSTTSVSSNGDHVPGPLPTVDWAESESTFHLACATPFNPPTGPITFFNLLEAMQVDRNILPSHSVWSVNMEHLFCRLWHPSHQELEQESIHWQEERLRSQLLTNSY